MKIEIEISEEKIMELAKVSSMDDLPRTIFYEASRQARDMAVTELKSKLTEKSYYGSEEYLKSDVREEIICQINEVIKKFVAEKFNEKTIEQKVNFYMDNCFRTWIEKRVNEELERTKSCIQFYSEEEIKQIKEDAKEE